MHAVFIESGGIVPLPRVGGALSHAAGSIRNLRQDVKPGFVRRRNAHPSWTRSVPGSLMATVFAEIRRRF